MKTRLFVILCLFSILFIESSCCKQESPKAIITVFDDQGNLVEGAEVTVMSKEGNSVYFNSGAKYSETAITNSAGQVKFEFQYEAIYDVKVQKSKDGNILNNLHGVGVVILKEGNTTEEKIKIRQ